MSRNMPIVQFDERKIDTIFDELNQCHYPGAAVGIAIGSRPVYRKGFGLSNLGLPLVLSPSTRLRIGSTSKHLTCFAYMLLCEDGKAGIDDSIKKHLPELNPVTHAVTMRQLMGNTSGLRDVHDIFTQFNDHYSRHGGASQSVTSADLLPLYRDIDDVNAAPGTAWIYNNGGWLILSAAIERITGQTLEQVMWERIFAPIGMNDSLLLRTDTAFVPNRGAEHVGNPARGFERMSWGVDGHIGAGAVVSTVDDMLRWLAHMDVPRIGSPTTWALMTTPQLLANGTSTGYGLGLFIDSYRGVETIWHSGSSFGGNAQMLKVPAASMDIAIIVNRQDVDGKGLVHRILDTCLPGLDPVKPTSTRAPVAGLFRSPVTGRVIQLGTAGVGPWVQEARQVVSIDGMDIPFEFDDAGMLRPAGIMGCLKLEITLRGHALQPESIQFSDFGNLDELAAVKRVDSVDPDGIIGHYRSEATCTEAEVSSTGSGVRLCTAGRFGSAQFQLERLGDDIWRARPAEVSKAGLSGGICSFDRESGDLKFSSYPTRPLRFRRSH